MGRQVPGAQHCLSVPTPAALAARLSPAHGQAAAVLCVVPVQAQSSLCSCKALGRAFCSQGDGFATSHVTSPGSVHPQTALAFGLWPHCQARKQNGSILRVVSLSRHSSQHWFKPSRTNVTERRAWRVVALTCILTLNTHEETLSSLGTFQLQEQFHCAPLLSAGGEE